MTVTAMTMMLGGAITPSVVSASETTTTATSAQTKSFVASSNPMLVPQQNELRGYAQSIGINLGESTLTITDSQMILLFEHMGVVVPPSALMAKKEGVTKVVSHGNGSWDIYLSASFIRNYYWAAGTFASALAVLVPGIGWGLAYTVISSIAGLVGSNISSGVVVQIRHWGIAKIYKQ